MIPPIFRNVDVTFEKSADHGDLHCGSGYDCIRMSVMLLSVMSGRHAAKKEHKKSPVPASANTRLLALLIYFLSRRSPSIYSVPLDNSLVPTCFLSFFFPIILR